MPYPNYVGGKALHITVMVRKGGHWTFFGRWPLSMTLTLNIEFRFECAT